MKRMLCVFAHPDDESFSSGATISKYVKEGWTVDLLCATRGEKGETGNLGDLPPEELGKVRQKELETAGTILGISSITFLGYADGDLQSDPPGELEDVIYEKFEEFMPDVVLTFDPAGTSNHPDHIRICFATTFAFQKYAKEVETSLKDHPDYTEEDAPKLYYTVIPESAVEYLQKKNILPTDSFGKPWKGIDDKKITTVISAQGNILIKKQALKAHASQRADVERFLSLSSNPLIAQEYFIFRMHGVREIFMGKKDIISNKL